MTENRLSYLAIISIEHKAVKIQQGSYLIEKFSRIKERQASFCKDIVLYYFYIIIFVLYYYKLLIYYYKFSNGNVDLNMKNSFEYTLNNMNQTQAIGSNILRII